MTIECHYHQCKYHGNWEEGEEGPFCYERECRATEKELKSHALLYSLELKGYTLTDLEESNPFNSSMGEL